MQRPVVHLVLARPGAQPGDQFAVLEEVEELVGDGPDLFLGGLAQQPQVLLGQPSAHLDEGVRGPPAQVGGQGLAGGVVRVQAPMGGLHERQTAEPSEELVGVLVGQDGGEQFLGGRVRLRRHFQGPAVGGGRHLADQAGQQGAQDVGGGCPDALAAPVVLPGGGREGERQRVAAGEPQDAFPQLGRHLGSAQQAAGLRLGERSQFEHPQQSGPGGVGGPLGLRGEASGQHHQGVVGRAGQETLPQPALQPLAVLEGVDEQDRAGDVEERRGGAFEVGRVAADEAAVEFQQQPAGRPGMVGEAAHQGRLADAARADQVERERRLRVAGQRPGEAVQLLVAADEGLDPRAAQSLLDGGHMTAPLLLFLLCRRRAAAAASGPRVLSSWCGPVGLT